ncbi:hypothetical protein QG37_02893 [Candidozyma auris]|uniref:Uncharacterized protein n=1 Tax=Candidozyma auris TaxID=498019 RepID=A0A0L0P0Q7_CANAR|nr:hypothetical protein QG37_02893 [[Candida] auris]
MLLLWRQHRARFATILLKVSVMESGGGRILQRRMYSSVDYSLVTITGSHYVCEKNFHCIVDEDVMKSLIENTDTVLQV